MILFFIFVYLNVLLAYESLPLLPSYDVKTPYAGAWWPNATILAQETYGWQIDLTNLHNFTNDNNSAIVMQGKHGTLSNLTFRIERANADMSVEMRVNVSDQAHRLCMCELRHEVYNVVVVNPAPNPTDVVLSVTVEQFVPECDEEDHHWEVIESLIIGMFMILSCCACTGLICFSGATKYICCCCCGRSRRPVSIPQDSYYSQLPSERQYHAHDDHKNYVADQSGYSSNSLFHSGSLNGAQDETRVPHILSSSFSDRSVSSHGDTH